MICMDSYNKPNIVLAPVNISLFLFPSLYEIYDVCVCVNRKVNHFIYHQKTKNMNTKKNEIKEKNECITPRHIHIKAKKEN